MAMDFTTSKVGELWKANFDIALKQLLKNTPTGNTETINRIRFNAGSLADKQTRRQINDPAAWRDFKNHRGKNYARDRKFYKVPDLFTGKPPRSQRRKTAIEESVPF